MGWFGASGCESDSWCKRATAIAEHAAARGPAGALRAWRFCLALADGHAGRKVELEAPVVGGLPGRDDLLLAGAVDVVEDDCCVVDELVVESGERRRACRAVAGLKRWGPIDDQQVDLVWHLVQSVPRRVPLQGGVDHASDLVEALSLKVVLYEGRPMGVMLKRGEYAAFALVEEPR